MPRLNDLKQLIYVVHDFVDGWIVILVQAGSAHFHGVSGQLLVWLMAGN